MLSFYCVLYRVTEMNEPPKYMGGSLSIVEYFSDTPVCRSLAFRSYRKGIRVEFYLPIATAISSRPNRFIFL